MHPLTFTYYDLKQSLCNVSTLFYLLVFPVGMYLLFGVMQDYGDYPVRSGNATAYVMVGMAVYGAVSGTVSASGSVVVELTDGWGRQLALTPATAGLLAFTRAARALVTGLLPVLAVNLAALLSSASIPVEQQLLCALVTVAGAGIFSFYGAAIALVVKNARAVSVAAGLVVFFSFFGTTFSPLPSSLLPYARLTPLYGLTQLSRYPFTGGDTIVMGADNWYVTEPVNYAVVNFVCWGAVFILSALLVRRRSTSR